MKQTTERLPNHHHGTDCTIESITRDTVVVCHFSAKTMATILPILNMRATNKDCAAVTVVSVITSTYLPKIQGLLINNEKHPRHNYEPACALNFVFEAPLDCSS